MSDAVVLETFDEMVADLWVGTPAQQIAARDLTQPLSLDELTELLIATS